MSQVAKIKVPEGYKMKANGDLVALGNVSALDMIRDEEVLKMVEQARQMQLLMLKFKSDLFDNFEDYVELAFNEYGVKRGGKKGNISLISFDGTRKVQLAVGERIGFDERLQAAKCLIDEYLMDVSKGLSDDIKTFVLQAFKVDKEGNISTAKVLAMQHFEVDDPRWHQAMKALKDSITITGSKNYLRFYQRENGQAKWQPIPLDMAAL